MSTSRNVTRGDIPSYYTTTTDDHNEDVLDDGYLARFSTYSTASANLPLPPSRPLSKPGSTYSTVSLSSASGSSIHDQAVPQTATHGRRASPPSQFSLSRPPTALALLTPHQPTITDAAPTDDRSLGPSPQHSSNAPLRSQTTVRPDSSSTGNSHTGSQRESQRSRPGSEAIDQDANRLSTTSTKSARTHLAAALAALPWAEPPPRTVSPSTSSSGDAQHPPPPSKPGFSVPVSASGSYSSVRSPAYAFLQDDPVPSPAMLGNARPSSRASVSGSAGGASRRSSVGSVHTPMAESRWMSPAKVDDRPLSGYSGMADVMSTSTHELSEESLMRSLSAAIRRLSRGPTVKSRRSSKSFKSGRSIGTTRSTKSKRGSASTISHRYAGTRWSVDPEGQARLIGVDGWAQEDVKQREADLDLLTLAGRAAVLEHMLRAGKRVSSSTLRARGRASLRSLHNRFTPSRTSFRPHAPSRLSTNSQRRSRVGTPRTSNSLRERLSRRLERHTSREDTFTELGDDSGDDEPVERLITPEKDGGVTVFPERISLPPPLPEKPRREGVHCTDVVCLSPTSPTPLFDYSRMEKAAPHQVESAVWVEQSPHLGHRSPHWRNRQSVMSYISTGNWDERAKKQWMYAVLVGAGVVLILIVGLLAGLLSRRS